MTLKEYTKELRADITRFEKIWIANNKKNPDDWPMEFDDDNEGAWTEQFLSYMSDPSAFKDID